MSGKRAAGLVLIMVGGVAALWGINLMNSLGSKIAGAIGMKDNTGPLAMGGGAALALIGLVFAVQKDTVAAQWVPTMPMRSSMASPAVLANVRAQSRMIEVNSPNEEVLAVVVAHLQLAKRSTQ